jgi:cGMP-dependent protein kinase
LAHIHDRNIVYRDLKPENVMLTERGDVRLIDFGFAKRVPYLKKDPQGVLKTYTRTFTVCGTPEYMAPEMLFNLGHNQAADVWSLGVLLYEMLARKTPFTPKKPDDQVEILTNIALAKVRRTTTLFFICQCQYLYLLVSI